MSSQGMRLMAVALLFAVSAEGLKQNPGYPCQQCGVLISMKSEYCKGCPNLNSRENTLSLNKKIVQHYQKEADDLKLSIKNNYAMGNEHRRGLGNRHELWAASTENLQEYASQLNCSHTYDVPTCSVPQGESDVDAHFRQLFCVLNTQEIMAGFTRDLANVTDDTAEAQVKDMKNVPKFILALMKKYPTLVDAFDSVVKGEKDGESYINTLEDLGIPKDIIPESAKKYTDWNMDGMIKQKEFNKYIEAMLEIFKCNKFFSLENGLCRFMTCDFDHEFLKMWAGLGTADATSRFKSMWYQFRGYPFH